MCPAEVRDPHPLSEQKGGVLYLVSTPIGNLKDMSLRAIEILKQVDLVACEDTRHSGFLLNHFEIKKPLISYFDFSEKRRVPKLIERLKNGSRIALISDAGTPGLSDPGYRIITAAIEEGIPIEAIPGPSAFLCALTLSGLPMDSFIFEGFVPIKPGHKKNKFLALRQERRTVIFYESPHRLLKTLEAIQETLGDIECVVAREITKKFEEVVRKKVGEIFRYFSGKKIQGEFVILFNLSHQPQAPGGLSESLAEE